MSKTATTLEDLRIDALFAAGYGFQKAGRFHKAIGAYVEALRRNPRLPSAYNNLGNCLRSIGRYEDALQQFDRALILEPGKQSAKLNKSLALLSLNRYSEAWPLYQHRLPTIEFRKEVLSSGKPEWDGSRLRGNQTLFLYSNQGLGDELQALRYLPMVTRLAGDVILEVHKANYELVRNTPGIREVSIRPRKSTALPDFDYHCELLTLPKVFETTFRTVPPPWRPPFESDRALSHYIAIQRRRFPNHKHVGLVWSGNPRNELNRFRACGLVHYLPLLQLEDFRFYSLQKGPPRNDISQFSDQCSNRLTDIADLLPNMLSTASAIDELDLLITTDTSVPHLAGTLGAKSWVLLQQPSDWRWTADQATTPWYPQLKLFRQKTPGVWTDLIDEVTSHLVRL